MVSGVEYIWIYSTQYFISGIYKRFGNNFYTIKNNIITFGKVFSFKYCFTRRCWQEEFQIHKRISILIPFLVTTMKEKFDHQPCFIE